MSKEYTDGQSPKLCPCNLPKSKSDAGFPLSRHAQTRQPKAALGRIRAHSLITIPQPCPKSNQHQQAAKPFPPIAISRPLTTANQTHPYQSCRRSQPPTCLDPIYQKKNKKGKENFPRHKLVDLWRLLLRHQYSPPYFAMLDQYCMLGVRCTSSKKKRRIKSNIQQG